MRIKKKDTEEFEVDESSVFRHFLPENASFSISFLDVEGTHENSSEAEVAYYVLSGEGVVKKKGKIVELEKEDVYYAADSSHVLEGSMELLVVRIPPAESPEEDI